MNEAPARRRGRRRSVPHRFKVITGGRGQPRPAPVALPEPVRPPPLVLLVLGFETLFFTGMVAAAMALRAVSVKWPPAALPPLPVAATAVHTAILLFSGFTMRYAMTVGRRGRRLDIETGMAATAMLGFAFVAGQAAEVVWLFFEGMAPTADGYTATFLVLVLATGAHVLCGILWVVAATTVVAMGSERAPDGGFVRSCAIFWYYGCALWIPVFVLLYLL